MYNVHHYQLQLSDTDNRLEDDLHPHVINIVTSAFGPNSHVPETDRQTDIQNRLTQCMCLDGKVKGWLLCMTLCHSCTAVPAHVRKELKRVARNWEALRGVCRVVIHPENPVLHLKVKGGHRLGLPLKGVTVDV